MANKKNNPAQTSEDTPTSRGPTTRSMIELIVLGALSGMWSVFLWGELLVARAGGTTFCELGGTTSCSQLWDGAFATQVHAITRIPVAGWGVIWSVLAIALPLGVLLKRDEGGSITAWVTASRLMGVLGAATVVGLLLVSATEGALCIGCLGTYVLVGLYAGVSLYGWRAQGFDEVGGAVGISAAGTVVLALALLYPGTQTPKSSASQQNDAMKAAAATTPTAPATNGRPVVATPTTPTAPTATTPPKAIPANGSERVKQFIGSVPPPMRQGIADSLAMYKKSATYPMAPPRAVLGGKAPLTIMEWTDVRCGHCAQLHEALEQIHDVVPPGSFNVVPRHFPLDGACNSGIQRRSPDGVSCLAAKAQICLESTGDKLFEYSGKLFKNQQSLTAAMVLDLAAPYMPKAQLQACIDSPDTAKKLDDDVKAALTTNPEGTPIVLINGKKGTGFGAFLFAFIVSGGNPDDPAFALLPPANPDAHVH